MRSALRESENATNQSVSCVLKNEMERNGEIGGREKWSDRNGGERRGRERARERKNEQNVVPHDNG
jgi:hypothetical protein